MSTRFTPHHKDRMIVGQRKKTSPCDYYPQTKFAASKAYITCDLLLRSGDNEIWLLQPSTSHTRLVSGVSVCWSDPARFSFHFMLGWMSALSRERVISSDPHMMTGWGSPEQWLQNVIWWKKTYTLWFMLIKMKTLTLDGILLRRTMTKSLFPHFKATKAFRWHGVLQVG